MTTFESTTPNNTQILGISIAVALHVAGASFLNLNSKKVQEPEIISPQPIMVEWVSNTSKKETQPKVEKPNTKQNTSAPKSVNKFVKPKIQKTITKPKPLLASNSVFASQMQVAKQEKIEPILEQALLKTEPISQSTTSISQKNSVPVSNESEKVLVTLPSLNANYLQNPAPIYPSQARENGEEGKVLLRVFVNENGTVEKLILKKSSGYALLDDAAKETVEKWKFVPAKQGDKTIAAWVVVPISFHLEG